MSELHTESVLLADADPEFVRETGAFLKSKGWTKVKAIRHPEQVLSYLHEHGTEALVLGSFSSSQEHDKEVLQQVKRLCPCLPILVLTHKDSLLEGVECMRLGAKDCLLRSRCRKELISALEHIIQEDSQMVSKQQEPEALRFPDAYSAITTRSPDMFQVLRYIDSIADTDLPVLITGESGTGKEMVARAVHDASGRSGNFVAFNIAGIDDNMFTDTLFGHVRGAFSGAEQERPGLVKAAAGGTLFLDEIGDLRMESQVKLLRLLQERNFYPLGSDSVCVSTARIVVATHKDLWKQTCADQFRMDLFYRLCFHEVHLPPLRERMEDLPLLTEIFVREFCESQGRPIPRVPPEVSSLLSNHDFPGNVRELKAILTDAVAQCRSSVLGLEHLRSRLQFLRCQKGVGHPTQPPDPIETPEAVQFPRVLPTAQDLEDMLFREALVRAQGNRSLAAFWLGISRSTLIRRLKRH